MLANLKVSIITVVYNRSMTISGAIKSVQMQEYEDISHIIVDGASTDGTMDIIEKSHFPNQIVISEPDYGMYDALNKGIKLSDADIVGLLHSDDFFADESVISDVVSAFSDPNVQLVYGDLDYVQDNNITKIVRRWVSGTFTKKKLKMGWMPPHPTVFVRKAVFEKLGMYDTTFEISADYDAMLRYFQSGICCAYIPRVLVKMRLGGMSNSGYKNIIMKMKGDYRAIKNNNVGGLGTLVLKNLSKIGQFIH
jgi:glycosyltransferase involved in cell wall biosynthesis